MLKGVAASTGIAIGKVLVLKEGKKDIEKYEVTDVKSELLRFKKALEKAKQEIAEIKENAEKNFGEERAMIFEAHLMILEDEEFKGSIEGKIQEGINGEYAIKETVEIFENIFLSMDNEYMRERAADIKDVGYRVIKILQGEDSNLLKDLKERCIVVAKDLTPSDTAQLKREYVLGFITELGGKTSHSAIIARALEIPAVSGIENAAEILKTGDFIILDGVNGIIYINPDEKLINEYQEKVEIESKLKNELLIYKDKEAITRDGKRIEIAANISSKDEIEIALKYGADGIGLFRTEFLFMNRETPPTEDEQFETYKYVLEKMDNKPVVIRTLDIGGDKKISYIDVGTEMNPFMGLRGIRLCFERLDLFKSQLRALLRASLYGNLKIMFPMISSQDEIIKAKKILEECKNEVVNQGYNISNNIEIGIMIEIPSAAIISDLLAKEVNFFSIGTNDLIQYTIAVDRMNEKVSNLYEPSHPAVLRLIKMVIDNAHREGKWAGMCGEMASDVNLIPLLIDYGIDELSMSAPSILTVKKVILHG
ncbi:Phosphoenolpyruvate-protein phosphotransferase [Caloramator mitchellensis]|uniref:Phosphoenolpyruvate-protein phosphotransferase n=1 Tax=Caloramator mitchellensis TaxID=908809 RepID=A0A0R3JRS2_CALMK|nr:phosphoenolpyruvate--protein phosphotransferase [Caloramator mitchellensis]KRQ86153.1 Phosphoenolpyruvate-protein phosphotransferase [Caloramator mitchellensis]